MAVDHGRISRGWMMSFNGMMQKGMMEFGRGGACVPARVALSRAHPSFNSPPQCVYFWYGNAAARTFGRAHRHRPYAFRLGGLRVKWLFWLCGIAWKNMMEIGRGGACVPARVTQLPAKCSVGSSF